MQTINHRGRVAAMMFAVAAASACGIEKQSAPPLAGPSEYGISITLTASPEVLTQDGESQTVITAVVRNDASQPIPNMTIRWDGTASTSRAMPVILSSTASVTDGNGGTTILLTSPPPPTETPSSPDTITIRATPIANGSDAATARSVTVRLRPMDTVPFRNSNPVAGFTIIPSRPLVGQDVTFNAQETMDEGEPCQSRCRYIWNFGDLTTGEGLVVTHRYLLPAPLTITLTVVDDRNGVGSLDRALQVDGPTPPVANFTVSPSSPQAGANVTFNATSSTVGTGATITAYLWDFGDGTSTVSTTVPAITRAYANPGTYIVTLTVTDSIARTATRTATVIVVP